MAKYRRTKIDDGFYPHLTEGAKLVGAPGIPMLLDLNNVKVPRDLIPFDKARQTSKPSQRRAYVHFYMHDRRFSSIITDAEKHLHLLQQFDGVITPDPTILDGQAACLQQANTYFNRAVGFFLQKHGVPVIPNGVMTEMADGSVVSFREVSGSDGTPIAEINIKYSSDPSGVKGQKIHFIEKKGK